MLTRRHIRVKVMQSLYAYEQSKNDNLVSEEKFLLKSMEDMYDLFLLLLNLMIETRNYAEDYLEKTSKKHLATSDDKDYSRKFLDNHILTLLDNSERFNTLITDRKLLNWSKDDEYKAIIWESLRNSIIYKNYIANKSQSFEEDKNFLIEFFSEIIAPNEKLYDYLEDHKLTWLDDLPIVNTTIYKLLERISIDSKRFIVPKLYRNMEDMDFATNLIRKTVVNENEFIDEVTKKTPNWDKDRIAEIDAIVMKMAICEFTRFPSIPVKVTINEYLEIAKEYSTPKSSIFINGILDKISKELKEDGKLNKMGRGLL